MSYRFQPRLMPAFAALAVAALCVRLGLWQWHKAEAKQALQTELEQRSHQPPVALPASMDNAQAWRYRPVKLQGSYETRYQILLDNQVEKSVAGYHVITPLKVAGSERFILVDRGWIPAPAQHSELPAVETPAGEQTIEGVLWLPSDKIFALQEAPPSPAWRPVWQNMDMKRYAHSVPFPIYPVVVRLTPDSPAGGFVRDWPQPAERIEMNLGYAYQWFGFAATAIGIYLFLSFRKRED